MITTMDELLEESLKDLYSAEKQLTKALPKMAKAAQNATLKQGFEEHLKQTEEQIKRLEQVCQDLGIKPTGKVCKAMEGLIAEGNETMSEGKPSPVLDAALIGAAQKIEHYEIAGYGTIVEMCRCLGHMEAADLLHQTLEEEKQTDARLNEVAVSEVNEAAADAEPEEEKPKAKTTAKKASPASKASVK